MEGWLVLIVIAVILFIIAVVAYLMLGAKVAMWVWIVLIFSIVISIISLVAYTYMEDNKDTYMHHSYADLYFDKSLPVM